MKTNENYRQKIKHFEIFAYPINYLDDLSSEIRRAKSGRGNVPNSALHVKE